MKKLLAYGIFLILFGWFLLTPEKPQTMTQTITQPQPVLSQNYYHNVDREFESRHEDHDHGHGIGVADLPHTMYINKKQYVNKDDLMKGLKYAETLTKEQKNPRKK